jgi:hypothetical protein
MTIIEEITIALLLSRPNDMRAIRHYIGWMKFRRVVNDHFYLTVHWAEPTEKYHWVGR